MPFVVLCGDDNASCGGGDANLIGPLHMCQASNQRSDEGAVASNTKQAQTRKQTLKGILHQKNFYRLNLIFWIVMGCGIAHFGRRGLFSHKCQIFICHNSTRMVA